MQLKFYFCKHCGKIITIVKDSGTPTICCNEEMQLIEPGTSDGTAEKHVPVIKISRNPLFINTVTVSVGSKPHPSQADHYIEWILLQTDKGLQQKRLLPGSLPNIDFAVLKGERVKAAYAYCNIHKLWKAECC